MELAPECTHFNFGHAGAERGNTEECNLKRVFSAGPAPACGGASSTWDVWEMQEIQQDCAAHSEVGRRLQGLHSLGGLGAADSCPFTEFDDRVQRVNDACCGQDVGDNDGQESCSPNAANYGVPVECSIPCAREYEPFWADCQDLISRTLDDEMPAFEALHQTCTHPDVKSLLYAINNVDCAGGWVKLLEDVSYSGVAVSDATNFLQAGDYTRIAAVRKSGYVSW